MPPPRARARPGAQPRETQPPRAAPGRGGSMSPAEDICHTAPLASSAEKARTDFVPEFSVAPDAAWQLRDIAVGDDHVQMPYADEDPVTCRPELLRCVA